MFQQLLNQAGSPALWIYSCHRNLDSSLRWIRSDRAPAPGQTGVFSGQLSVFIDAVEQMTSDENKTFRTKAYGFSWGGTEIMLVLLNLDSRREEAATNFVLPYYLSTVDPISLSCSIANLGQPRCTSFPDWDVPYADQWKISTFPGIYWHHWYETRSTQTHSNDTYPFPSEQTLKDYGSIQDDMFTSHLRMMDDFDNTIFSEFRAR